MVKTLGRAIAEVSALPEATQEEIGRQWLSHLEKLRELRSAIDEGIRSLEAEGGIELNIEDFLKEMHERVDKR
jgi:hypothetical protein